MQNRILINSSVLIFSIILLVGCSSFELKKFSDTPDCITTIEGNYFEEPKRAVYSSILYLEQTPEAIEIPGTLISFDSTGAKFIPSEKRDTAFYAINNIAAVVKQGGKILYGEIPMKYRQDFYNEKVSHKLKIGISNLKTRRYRELVLLPNEPFSYCIDPGSYKILKIHFLESDEVVDQGTELPEITFTIDTGKVNYLGNIFVDYKTREEENTIVIPCNYYDANASAMAGMFGMIGGLTYAIANDIANSGLHHVIHIERENDFIPEANLEVSEVDISVTLKEE